MAEITSLIPPYLGNFASASPTVLETLLIYKYISLNFDFSINLQPICQVVLEMALLLFIRIQVSLVIILEFMILKKIF